MEIKKLGGEFKGARPETDEHGNTYRHTMRSQELDMEAGAEKRLNLVGLSENMILIHRMRVLTDRPTEVEVTLFRTKGFTDGDLDGVALHYHAKVETPIGKGGKVWADMPNPTGPTKREFFYEDLDGERSLHASVSVGKRCKVVFEFEYEPWYLIGTRDCCFACGRRLT